MSEARLDECGCTESVLALDLGTSRLKAGLFCRHGRLLTRTAARYPASTQEGGRVEQSPQDWLDAILQCCRQLGAQGLACWPPVICSITGQMHGLVLLDGHYRPLRPAIICADVRADAETEMLTREVGRTRLLQLTGGPPTPVLTAPKVLWMQRHEPATLRAARGLLLPKDYVGLAMTGVYATDFSDASGTMLFDLTKAQWSTELCAAAGIDPELLPPVLDSASVRGEVTAGFAAAAGLRAGTPVIVGAGDLGTTVLGTGATDDRTLGVSIGSAGVVFRVAERVRSDLLGKAFYFHHALKGKLVAMGSIPAAGISAEWFEGIAGPAGEDEERQGPTGAAVPSLFFLPFLLGTGVPYMDYRAQAAFLGLAHSHTRHDMRRAVWEGVAYSLRQSVELLMEGGGAVERLVLCGGGSRNRQWTETMASVLGRPLWTLKTNDAALVGAGTLGALAVGWYKDVSAAVQNFARTGEAVQPHAERVRAYDEGFRRYLRMVEAVQGLAKQGFWQG